MWDWAYFYVLIETFPRELDFLRLQFGEKKRDVRSIAKNSSFCVLLAIAGLGTKGEGMGMEITRYVTEAMRACPNLALPMGSLRSPQPSCKVGVYSYTMMRKLRLREAKVLAQAGFKTRPIWIQNLGSFYYGGQTSCLQANHALWGAQPSTVFPQK